MLTVGVQDGVVTDPNGGLATSDRERTAAAYLGIDADADCSCVNCRNYRAAWRPELMPPEVMEACEKLGIDPSKALEVTALGFDEGTGLQSYHGNLPFFGTVTK